MKIFKSTFFPCHGGLQAEKRGAHLWELLLPHSKMSRLQCSQLTYPDFILHSPRSSGQSERGPQVTFPPKRRAQSGRGAEPKTGLQLPEPNPAQLCHRFQPGRSSSRRCSGSRSGRAPIVGQTKGRKPDGKEQPAKPGHQHEGGLGAAD